MSLAASFGHRSESSRERGRKHIVTMVTRRIIASVNVTLDGFMSGPAGDLDNLDWVLPNLAEATADVGDLLDTVDTFLLGRITYQGFIQYWPTATGEFADKMNKTPKIVCSEGGGGLAKAEWGEWGNARLVDREAEAEMARLKGQPGRDMVTFGSATLVQRFTNAGLIDQYRLVVHPVIQGSGKRLFDSIDAQCQLTLVSAKPYAGGAVLLTYDVTDRDR